MIQAKALASKGAFSSIRYRKRRDRIIEFLLLTAGLVAVFTTAAIVFILVYESIAFFDHVSIRDFLTDTMWTPLFADALQPRELTNRAWKQLESGAAGKDP